MASDTAAGERPLGSGCTHFRVLSPMPATATAATAPDATSAWGRFLVVAKPYWTGDRKRVAWAVLVGLIVLMLLDTQLAVLVNRQTGELTSALSARDEDRFWEAVRGMLWVCLLYTSPSPRDRQKSRMPSSA